MALTLTQITNIAVGRPQKFSDFRAARIQVAWNVLAEDPATNNHAKRLAWAQKVMTDYDTDIDKEYTWCLSHANYQAGGAVTDANAIAACASFVDAWA